MLDRARSGSIGSAGPACLYGPAMSDLLINIRVGMARFQLTRSFRIRVSRNECRRGLPRGWLQVHELFGWVRS